MDKSTYTIENPMTRLKNVPSEENLRTGIYFVIARDDVVSFMFVGEANKVRMKITNSEADSVYEASITPKKAQSVIRGLIVNDYMGLFTFRGMHGFYAALTGTDDRKKIQRGFKSMNKKVNRKYKRML